MNNLEKAKQALAKKNFVPPPEPKKMNKKYKYKGLVVCRNCSNSYSLSTVNYGPDYIEFNSIPTCCGFEMLFKLVLLEVKF